MDNSSEKNIEKEPEEPYSNVLYVADLPNETTNEDLQKMFKDYHFHFASLNNFKHNQVWAQVYLENKNWANKARHELNGYIIKPMNGANSMKGKPVRICKYEGKGQIRQTNIKQSLLIKNIDSQMSQKEFYQKFLEFGDIVSGKIEYDENGVSKGFGYIYYYNEESAEKAKLNLNGKYFYGKAIEIVNLIPGKKTKTNAITLFVLNIPSNITEKELMPIFEKFGPVTNISVNQRGFAYVSYMNFEGATKCLKQMKAEPFSFPGMPNIVVKNVSSKEERDANKNFVKSNEAYNFGIKNLNIQFNLLYCDDEIKTDLDLDKQIRLFIKVVMLMDFSPKEVLIDFESMSGLVQFEKLKDYNLFLRKYHELCEKQYPSFECIPYNYPFPSEENQNQNNYMFNNMPMLYGPKSMPPVQNSFNNNQAGVNNFKSMNYYNQSVNNPRNNNFQNFQNIPQGNKINNNAHYPNMSIPPNISQNNITNNTKNYDSNNNNFNGGNRNNNGTGNFNKNRNYNNRRQNYNNNNYNNNNRRNNQRNNYNNNNNNNKKYIIRPGDNIDLSNMKSVMLPLYQMNPFMRPQMMPKPQWNRNFQDMNQNNNNNYFNDINKKNELDLAAQRNLEKLNPSQLLSQFNKPPINVYENMFDSKEQEEIRMEIADSIYEIAYAKYPTEASKITGMINEKGIEKMNMLLSKKEDLDEIIDRAYEMIINSKKEQEEKNIG